jgi:DNA-binding NarL/FixJ family response regulator
MLKVLVADALPVFRAGIKEILFEEFTFVYFDEASDGPSLLEKVKAQKWDIIIADLAIHNHVTETINQILRLKPRPHILILSSDEDTQCTTEIISKVTVSLLSKKTTVDQLIKALQGILTNQDYTVTSS